MTTADEIADHLRIEAERVAQRAAWMAQRDRTGSRWREPVARSQIWETAETGEVAEERNGGISRTPLGIRSVAAQAEMRDWIQRQLGLLVQRAEKACDACRRNPAPWKQQIGQLRHDNPFFYCGFRAAVPGADLT